MSDRQSPLGITTPLSHELRKVTTTSHTTSTHREPTRSSIVPASDMDDSGFSTPQGFVDPRHPYPSTSSLDYAELHLAPARTTSVVTTTTTVTTHFAPIRIPKSRAVRPARSSFSAPSGSPALPPPTPQSSFVHFMEAEEAARSGSSSTGSSSSSALRLDPKVYPLSQTAWPGSLKRFRVELGGMAGTFFESAAEVPDELRNGGDREEAPEAGEGGRGKGKGKERMSDDIHHEPSIPHLSRAERGPLQQRRQSRRGRTGGAGQGANFTDEDEEEDVVDELVTSHRAQQRLSPGPPRKRPRAQSTSLDHAARRTSVESDSLALAATLAARRSSQSNAYSFTPGTTAATLPSPNQSPPSPVPTFGGEDSQELKDDDLLEETPRHSRAASASALLQQQAFDFGQGPALSGLLSLPSFVDTFDQLSPSLQSYLIFTLLRRSSIPVLQTINNIIAPSLRRDFLTDLPPELSVQILGYLDAQTLCRASLVCKGWRRLVDGEWRIWKQKMEHDGLWIGDGSEEREAREIATGLKENLFLKRWKAGVWDEQNRCSWSGKLDSDDFDIDGVADYRRHSTSGRLASPSSSREASPFPPVHTIHPFKTLYRRRFVTRRNWKQATPKRTTFTSSTANTNVVTCLQFDKEKIVSASDDHSIHVFDTQTGQERAELQGHEGGVWALQYIGNVLVSGSTDRTVRIWDLDTARCTHEFIGHTSTVRCLQIVEPLNVNPDPKGAPIWEPPFPLIVTGSRDWSLRVWKLPAPGKDREYHPAVPMSPTEENTDPSDNPYHLRHLSGHRHAVRALAAQGRTLVSGSYDTHVRVWDIMTGECRHELVGHSQKVYSVVYDHQREQCASGSMDGTVRVWSTRTGECRAVLEGHSSLVGLLGLSHRHLVSAAADWTLRIWNPDTGACLHSLSAHQGAITCFQHDEFKVISGSDGTLKMWDVQTGEFVRDLLNNLTGVWQVAFDQRYCVAAVQRNGQSEFEILDFGPVDDEPPESSASIKIEDDDMYEGQIENDVAMAGARGDSIDDTRATSSSRYPPPPPTLLRAAEFPRRNTTSTSTSNVFPASTSATTPVNGSSNSRTVRRTNSSRNLHAQAQADAAIASTSTLTANAMEVEQDHNDEVFSEVKDEEGEEEGWRVEQQ
ncbi:SPOSA6832_01593 [Sporobolomyces salmonicolor]|uniref:SPOSA6832_01593-mRNA-1:cds n=1 Tax=Sporidiobolus salmonicolor TaxID=5005 RepID=A0A0D6EK45_SPOSA|nr:SPOSA6832_01593 [Sporobolomyces salmonicolor]